MMDDELVTTGEAATYLGVSPQRVTVLVETGKIARHRVGCF